MEEIVDNIKQLSYARYNSIYELLDKAKEQNYDIHLLDANEEEYTKNGIKVIGKIKELDERYFDIDSSGVYGINFVHIQNIWIDAQNKVITMSLSI